MVRLAANLSFFFKELPILQRFGAAARAGFRHTEFMFAGDAGYEVEQTAPPLLQETAMAGYRALLGEVKALMGPDIETYRRSGFSVKT